MKKSIEPKRFRDLLRLLTELQRLHERLAKLGQAKLDAIRRADIHAMREVSSDEREVTRRIQQREGLRRQLMDAIGESLGLPAGAARALPLSQLSARVSAPQRAALEETAGKLRDTIRCVARVNRVIGAASRAVAGHLGHVLGSVSPVRPETGGYHADGAPSVGAETRIFETLG